MVLCGLDSSGSGYGPVEGPSELCNEPRGSIKFGEIFEWLSDWWLLKDSSPLRLVRKRAKETVNVNSFLLFCSET
jgi:hypothetical protein